MPKKKKNSTASKRFPHLKKLFLFSVVLFFGVFIALAVQLSGTKSNAQTVPQPVGQSGSWNLIYADEFVGTALDTTKWVTCYPWSGDDDGCAHGNELEWYLPGNVSVSSDAAVLQAKKQTVQGSDGKTYAYTSGMITTGRNKWDTTPAKFAFTYGYIEVRAKIPSGQGLWPALWLLPFNDADPGKWPPEIDIMEILGHDTTTSHMHFHYKDSTGVDRDSGGSYTGGDYASDFHTYAVSWEPTAIRWYIDGVERRTAFTDAQYIPQEPMYFLANLAVGGSWPGAPDSSTVFPNSFVIDYVRIWQKAAMPSATPTIAPTSTLAPTASPTKAPTPTPTKIPTPTPAEVTPPTVAIYQPVNNSTVPRSQNVPIYASAADTSGIQKVEFYVNGSLKCTDTTPNPYSCIWRVPKKRNTNYKLTAKAYDAKGNTATSAIVKVATK